MPKVRATDIAQYLRTNHSMTVIRLFADMIGIDGRKVAWPATPGIKLGVGRKKWRRTAHTAIDAASSVIPELTCECALGALLSRHVVRFG